MEQLPPSGHHPPEHQPITAGDRVLPASVTSAPGCIATATASLQRWRLSHLLIQTVHVDSAFLSVNVVKRSSHEQEVCGSIHVNVHRAQLRAKIGPQLQPRKNSVHRECWEAPSSTPQQG